MDLFEVLSVDCGAESGAQLLLDLGEVRRAEVLAGPDVAFQVRLLVQQVLQLKLQLVACVLLGLDLLAAAVDGELQAAIECL